ncbi:Peptide chain release factor 1, mitochondrial [Mycoemilia scoparia]|uniref:Peptide chain release factor 1, mitochondrial n=1 Tax=Mycoemilia scoparia TaxID=417184 RepID=A0A9W7ZU99_9FUNG|nr:Peptide chain release factor 1, mitochondrial [Mycoemilia scoparia]
MTQLSKEISDSDAIVNHYTELLKLRKDLSEMKVLMQDANDDKEMKQMAIEEQKEILESIKHCESELIAELTPKDDADKASAVLEIRAGTGGDEASLFSGELLRMYERFAQSQRWKLNPMSINQEGAKVKDAIIEVKGKNVFGKLRFESGVHRVQRVPATENMGRVHTSTVTVAVLPEATEVQVKINEGDLRIDVFRASGKGGQHVNTTDSAVRITHLPTGLAVENQEERSQLRNKEKAMGLLRARLYDRERKKVEQERRNSRNKLIGTGDRSEKIRTYNFAQNRITDHRINYSIYNIEGVMSGELLPELINQLRIQHDLEELASAVNS